MSSGVYLVFFAHWTLNSKLQVTRHFEKTVRRTEYGSKWMEFLLLETTTRYFLSVVSFSKLWILYDQIKIQSIFREREIISMTVSN